MNEKSLTVLEQYELETFGNFRIKGNYGWDTSNGKVILQEYNHSNEKMKTMKIIYDYLEDKGFIVDSVIMNKAGNYISISEDGYPYILKKWYKAEECSVTNEKHLFLASSNLGRFHKCLKETSDLFGDSNALHPGINLLHSYIKHNKEIIHIKNYIKKRKNKNSFESDLLEIMEKYYQQGVKAYNRLLLSNYNKIYQQAIEEKTINHGSYNYHNIMFNEDDIIMTNLLKVNFAPAIQDFYDFLRKSMEKNDWNIGLAEEIIKEYERERKINNEEKEVLKILFSYPEKFWKIINYYYNSNKGWYSVKNEEKLNKFKKQEELRMKFIDFLEKK